MSTFLRSLGRSLVVLSLPLGLVSKRWDTSTYDLLLGAVLLWQGGFDFSDLSRRYR